MRTKHQDAHGKKAHWAVQSGGRRLIGQAKIIVDAPNVTVLHHGEHIMSFSNKVSATGYNSPPSISFKDYKKETSIDYNPRSKDVKAIDKLVQRHLEAPDSPQRWHDVNTFAPKHMERLSQSSPVRHQLILTQLNQMGAHFALRGTHGASQAQYAQHARDDSRQPERPNASGPRSYNATDIGADASGRKKGRGSGGGRGGSGSGGGGGSGS
jgi:uncharacterized membrane protein YgcG